MAKRAGRLWPTPLFVHKGSLSCTGLERGAMLGPSICVGSGNPWARGSLQGWGRSPYPPGLVRWWRAWLCMLCLASLSFGPCTPPARQGFSTHWENSLPQDHLAQNNPWSLAGMPGPSEKEEGTQMGGLRGSGQVIEAPQGPVSHRVPRRPGWRPLYRVLGDG